MKLDRNLVAVLSVGVLCGVLSITAMEQGNSLGKGSLPVPLLSPQDELSRLSPISFDEAKEYINSYSKHIMSPVPLDDEPGFYLNALDNLYRVKMACMTERDKVVKWIADADLFSEEVFAAGIEGTGGKQEALARLCLDISVVYGFTSRRSFLHTFNQEMVHRFKTMPASLDSHTLGAIQKILEDDYDERSERSRCEQGMLFAEVCPEYLDLRRRSRTPVDIKRSAMAGTWRSLACQWGLLQEEAQQLFADRDVADIFS